MTGPVYSNAIVPRARSKLDCKVTASESERLELCSGLLCSGLDGRESLASIGR